MLLRKQNSIQQMKATFPDEYATNVHEICLTYLVPSAPFNVQLNRREMTVCTKKAATSPIPATIFDTLLDLVIENLYYNVFPRYMLKVGIEPAYDPLELRSPPLTPIEELSDEDESIIDQESLDCDNLEFQVDPQNQLYHRTSQVFDYMCSTASSVYSDIECSDDDDELNLDGEFDPDFYSLMNSHGTKYSQQSIEPVEDSFFDFDESTANDSNSLVAKIDPANSVETKSGQSPEDLDTINMIFDTYQNPPKYLPKRKGSLEPTFNNKNGGQKSQKESKSWRSLIRNSIRGTFMR